MNFSCVVNIEHPTINLVKAPEHENCLIVNIKMDASYLALHFNSKQDFLMFIKSLEVSAGVSS